MNQIISVIWTGQTVDTVKITKITTPTAITLPTPIIVPAKVTGPSVANGSSTSAAPKDLPAGLNPIINATPMPQTTTPTTVLQAVEPVQIISNTENQQGSELIISHVEDSPPLEILNATTQIRPPRPLLHVGVTATSNLWPVNSSVASAPNSSPNRQPFPKLWVIPWIL